MKVSRFAVFDLWPCFVGEPLLQALHHMDQSEDKEDVCQEKSLWIPAHQGTCLLVCLFVCLYVCLFVCMSVCLFVLPDCWESMSLPVSKQRPLGALPYILW